MSDKRNYEIQMQNALIHSAQFPTCTNCEEWAEDQEQCKKYHMKPPAKVIVTGCVTWIMHIPF